jgi:hypothetical protein
VTAVPIASQTKSKKKIKNNIPALPQMASWRGAYLINQKNFFFFNIV